MKFSSVLLLSPFVSLALAAPRAMPQTDPGYDLECVQKYCMTMMNGADKCAADNGVTTTDATTYNTGYTDCICAKDGDVRSYYDDCMGCFSDESMKSSYSGMLEQACNTGTVDIPDTTTDDSTDTTNDSTDGTDTSSDDKTSKDDTSSDSSTGEKTNTSTTSDKKNSASGKSASLTMAGAMVIAGGIIAAM